MFYRYEAKSDKEEDWVGVFQTNLFNPWHRRAWGRRLCEPKWYQTHKDVESKCWFTEEGYQKHREFMENMLNEVLPYHTSYSIRVVKQEEIGKLAVKGKIQCVELL